MACPPNVATSCTRPSTRTRDPLARYAPVLREHGDFARSVVDLVEPDRDERHAPRAGDHAIYRDRAVLIPPGVVFELSDARTSSREARSPRRAGPAQMPHRDERVCSTCLPPALRRHEWPREIGQIADGMRRCQRLPELTHPVDSARPQRVTSNPVPSEIAGNPLDAPDFRPVAVTLADLHFGRAEQPFAKSLRLSIELPMTGPSFDEGWSVLSSSSGGRFNQRTSA